MSPVPIFCSNTLIDIFKVSKFVTFLYLPPCQGAWCALCRARRSLDAGNDRCTVGEGDSRSGRDAQLGLGVAAEQKLVDLSVRLRCRECDARGGAVVSVKWREERGKV
jgi:hypothetical protein